MVDEDDDSVRGSDLSAMSFAEFERILENENDPRHKEAQREAEKILAPVRKAFDGSSAFTTLEKQARLSEAIGRTFPTSNFRPLLSTLGSAAVAGSGSIQADGLVETEPVVLPPRQVVQDPTVGDVGVGLQREANLLLVEQRDELRRMNSAGEKAAKDAQVAARGAKVAAWWAVGVGVATLVATVVGIVVAVSLAGH